MTDGDSSGGTIRKQRVPSPIYISPRLSHACTDDTQWRAPSLEMPRPCKSRVTIARAYFTLAAIERSSEGHEKGLFSLRIRAIENRSLPRRGEPFAAPLLSWPAFFSPQLVDTDIGHYFLANDSFFARLIRYLCSDIFSNALQHVLPYQFPTCGTRTLRGTRK